MQAGTQVLSPMEFQRQAGMSIHTDWRSCLLIDTGAPVDEHLGTALLPTGTCIGQAYTMSVRFCNMIGTFVSTHFVACWTATLSSLPAAV